MPLKLANVPISALLGLQLSHGGLRVLIALGTHSDRSGTLWASQERIGKIAGIGRRTASKAIRELTEARYVVILGHKGHVYHYLLQDPADLREERCAPGGAVLEDEAPPVEAQEAAKCAPEGAPKCGDGGAQTSLEPIPLPDPPPCEGEGKRRPLRACGAQGARRAPPPTPPPDPLPKHGEGEKEAPLRPASLAKRRGGGGQSLKTGPPVRKSPGPPRRSALQFALLKLDGDERQALARLAVEKGEEAALSAFGFDKRGRRG